MVRSSSEIGRRVAEKAGMKLLSTPIVAAIAMP